MATFLILSGPSCVGKGPLLAALRRCRPDLAFEQPVVHTSRSPRPGEQDGVDFHFRDADTIRGYDPQRFYALQQRDQMRGIDLDEVAKLLGSHERVILELHPPHVPEFVDHPRVQAMTRDVHVVTVLLQPLSVDEVRALCTANDQSEAEAVADVMRPKQIHRALRQGKLLTAEELADIDTRARAAWDEMRDTTPFDHVFVNHDAEGADHWRHTPPVGDAGATMRAVASLLSL